MEDKIYVLFYSSCPPEIKPAGIPDEWVWKASKEFFPGSVEMTSSEYENYLNEKRPIYDAWLDGVKSQKVIYEVSKKN